MSANYVVSRIKEALYNAGGDKRQASQQIMAWAMEDMQLLKGLARAHIGGIVAYQIDRVAAGKDIPTSDRPAQKTTPQAQQPASTQGMQSSSFGRELLQSASRSNAAVFGLETYESPTAPKKTSQRHIDALNHIAAIHKTLPSR